jgi:hypothetical protein
MKNSKVYDFIFYFNERDLLEKRISYLEGVVDKFIVINFGNETIFPKDIVVLENYKTKFSFFQKDFLNEILHNEKLPFIKSFDYLFFSQTKEIPDLSFYENIKTSQSMNVIYCSHENLHWNDKLKSPFIYLGTRVFNVTCILQTKNLYKEFKPSNLFYYVRSKVEKTGWVLNGFQVEPQLIDNINFWGPEKVKDLVKEKGIQYFKENHLSLDIPQKSTILIPSEVELPKVLSNSEEIKRRGSKDFFICLEDYEIETPKKVLYGDYSYSDFVEKFKKNELLRILRKRGVVP